MQIGETGAIFAHPDGTGAGSAIHITANAYYDSQYEYLISASDEASRYTQENGKHLFYTAPAGTHGNAITFTEIIEAQSSQIKFSVPTFKLAETDGDANAGPIFILQRDNSASEDNNDVLGEIQFQGSDSANTTSNVYAQINAQIEDISHTSEDGRLHLQTQVAGTMTDTLVCNSGKVGIGTSSPGRDFVISNGGAGGIEFDAADTNQTMSMFNRSTSSYNNLNIEALSVDFLVGSGADKPVSVNSNGTVLIGGTSAEDVGTSPGLVIQKASGQTAMAFEILDDDTSADSNNVLVGLRFDQDNNADGAAFIEFQDSGGVIGSIKVNGAGNTAFNDSSDERLKENITDVDDGYLELINDIRIRKFDWIDRPNSMKKVGVIAQELEKVIPNVVSKGGDNPNKQPYQVAYPTLVPYLIKAVQELSAKVTKLESKLGE